MNLPELPDKTYLDLSEFVKESGPRELFWQLRCLFEDLGNAEIDERKSDHYFEIARTFDTLYRD